jgi:hypothetical protein
MSEWIDSRTRVGAAVAVIVGIVLFLGLELIDEPGATPVDLLLELLEIEPRRLNVFIPHSRGFESRKEN